MANVNVFRRFLPYLPKYGRGLQRKFLDLLPRNALHELANISDVLHRRSIEIYESKKRALAEGDEAVEKQIGEGKDIMSILST